MNTALPAARSQIDIERRFVVGFLVLLAVGCATADLLIAERASVSVAIVLIATCVAAIAALIAHSLLFVPLRRLVVMAKAIGSGDFSGRLRSTRRDEIGSLAREMDTMCDRLQAAERAAEVHIAALEQLRHSDRVATLGRLASSVAHELGNPLNVVELRAQLILSEHGASLDHARHNAAVILEQSQRMTRIIDEILTFARMRPARIELVELVTVLRSAIALCQHVSKRHGTSIVFDAAETGIELAGDADKLLQVFVNLIANGIEAMPHGGRLTVSVSEELRAPLEDPEGPHEPYARVDVTDEGVGIAQELQPKVFEAFYSTKSSVGGTGLGLSVAQGIAHEHAGSITVSSELGRGSTFHVYLPKRGLRAAANGC